MKYPRSARIGRRRRTVIPQTRVMRRNLANSASLHNPGSAAAAVIGELLPRSLHVKHSAHAVMTHATQFQTQNVMPSRFGETNTQAVYVSRHGLRLREEMVVRGVHGKTVIDVQAGDAELNQRAGAHLDGSSVGSGFVLLVIRYRCVGKRQRELL